MQELEKPGGHTGYFLLFWKDKQEVAARFKKKKKKTITWRLAPHIGPSRQAPLELSYQRCICGGSEQVAARIFPELQHN